MKIIVGLGNPGMQYVATRHNIGFEVIERLAYETGIRLDKRKFKAIFGQGQIAGEKVILMQPQTYMNLSGESVRAVMDFYSLTPREVVVVYDEISLDLGQLRIREKGSAGGHNGMKNIIAHLGTQEFIRFRVGVGPQTPGMDSADFVLRRFNKEEMKIAIEMALKTAEAVEAYLRNGIEYAMNHFNG
ncbi:aminoacyl-tRNA hydrolase [Clostridiales bacterium COT073_COT-073]|nr:aminoacyl-tRNA hydrolase [Clostridiales bacterium COT073_COT-073]